jgi:hypothetical protein
MLKRFASAALLLSLFSSGAAASGHLELTTQVEYLDFDNSRQKKEGARYGAALSLLQQGHHFRFAYERTVTHTYQPPLPENLHVDKYMLAYSLPLGGQLRLKTAFMAVEDNLAPTDGGRIYGMGLNYGTPSALQSAIMFYRSRYDDFGTYQADLSVTKSFPVNAFRIGLSGVLKSIWIDDRGSTSYTANAKRRYLTPGIRAHLGYRSWRAGVGAFFGKRLFGVMEGGMRVQHHAMEMDRTYMAGITKSFGATSLQLRYVYLRATELPLANPGVTVDNTMLRLQHRF